MEHQKAFTLFLLILLSCSGPHTASGESDALEVKAYIIQVRHPVEQPHLDFHHPEAMEAWYKSLLDSIPDVTSKTMANEPRIIHSYTHAMTGFAAKLTDNELEAVKKQDWFAYAHPNLVYSFQTTHSPRFLGLNPGAGLWKDSNYGRGIIIGVVDTGVAVGHPSFDDEGMPPPPAKWQGKCEPPVVCNNKIIAAKSLIKGQPPTDDNGHGSHTASTAAGTLVKNASVLGTAAGWAVGMAPLAHLAIYKVLDQHGLTTAIDIVAGIGAAIRDGCDVISLSLAMLDIHPFYDEAVSIATFSAIKRNIFVSAAASNSGPGPSTLRNAVPWVLTVGASTMDRHIAATVKLGSGLELEGESVVQPTDFGTELRPLIYAGDLSNRNPNSSQCGEQAFDGFDVRGKIVVCDRDELVRRIDKGRFVLRAGGVGMVLANNETNGYRVEYDKHVLPASAVSYADGNEIKAYINSTSNPTGTILFKGTVTGTPRAPMVGAFSSRGPFLDSPGILKPDIIGPGVNILAAWPASWTNQTGPGPFMFNFGTSMSCPHLSGIAAMLKVAHPDWSPSAIKSAIMTTAYTMDNHGGPILDDHQRLPADLFAMGAGHVDVSRAHDPGLIYVTRRHDYVPYLCGLLLTEEQMHAVTNKTVNCSLVKPIADHDLNYPSMAVAIGLPGSNVSLPRKVTNVGEAKEKYWVEVDAPPGVSVVVKPAKLKFKKANIKKKFRVIFTSTGGGSGYAEGQFKWVSKKHVVRSPISIKFN